MNRSSRTWQSVAVHLVLNAMTPWTLRLIFANAAVFLLQGLLPGFERFLYLVPARVLVAPWTLVTYMFLHGGFMHLLFNMLALFFFGPRLEARLGSREFLGLYFASGITGGLLSLVFPVPFAPIAIVGASGAVFGVLLGFAMFWPREHIYIWGILPIEARWLVAIATVISLYSGFGARGGGIAHFAHLGGFVGGFLFLKWLEIRSPARRFKQDAAFVPKRPSGAQDIARWKAIRRDDLHEVNRSEVDRILDKISAQGLDSLTIGERETLERFSRRQ